MVVIIGAIVIGVALGGKSSKTFKGDQQALHSSDNPAAVTQSPQNTEPGSTDDPGAATEQPGDTDPAETTTPQATHNIYITPVPIISMRPVDETKDVAKAGEHNDVIPDVQERLMILWYMDQDEPTDYFGNITKMHCAYSSAGTNLRSRADLIPQHTNCLCRMMQRHISA